MLDAKNTVFEGPTGKGLEEISALVNSRNFPS